MAISRYRNSKILKDENNLSYLETFNFPNVNWKAIPHIVIQYAQGDRLDILAAKHLGSGESWWVIAMMNGLDWPWGIPYGTLLMIPLDISIIEDLF